MNLLPVATWLRIVRADLAAAVKGRRPRVRAGQLFEAAMTLQLTRPRGWAGRRVRLLRAVSRTLAEPTAGMRSPEVAEVPPAVPVDSEQLAADAYAALRRARHPVRRLVFAGVGAMAASLAALAVVAGLLAAASPRIRHGFFPPDLAASATWTSSSVFPGTAAGGTGPLLGEPYFFHTQLEDHPWLQVRLARPARVNEIRITTRTDCCLERTVPFNVEVPDGDGDWELLCQRRVPFRKWTCHAGQRMTDVIRLHLAATNFLHLSRVEIFE